MIMKNILLIKIILPVFAGGLLFFSSCKKGNEVIFEKNFTGIYFQKDSIYYSFGITSLEVRNYELQVPVKIMGEPVAMDRTFSVEVIPEKTNAVAGEQYTLLNSFLIKKDSINGYFTINIDRTKVGINGYKLSFRLLEKAGFKPVNESFQSTTIHFNNNVEKPNWKDFQGNAFWPTAMLGVWRSDVYIKFVEYFRAMEQTSPLTYDIMVGLYGKDMINLPSGWPTAYQETLKKYTLIPLYKYYMEQNPLLGVTIPRPAGY